MNINDLQVGVQYIISNGSRQQNTGRGTRERHIIIIRFGSTSETKYYKGRSSKPGMWVTDHSDTDKEKLFVTSRIIYARTLTLDELI